MKINRIPILSNLGLSIQTFTSLEGLRTLPDRMGEQQRLEAARLINSGALILGRVSSSGLGFLTWLITARLFATREVGIASGVVSAMMLCVQLALFGVGSAFIALYSHHQNRPARMVNTALSIVSAMAVVTALLFLLLSSTVFQELRVVGRQPLYALLFLAITLFGTVNVLFDHISIAIHRGDQVLFRNLLFGVITILIVTGIPFLLGAQSSVSIVFAWMIAGLAACSLGAWHLFRSLPEYRFRLEADPEVGRQLVKVGLPNYLLTLSERAPNWILPLLVTELLSPIDNAHWYAVWMMAWVVFLVPISIGQNLFAEIAQQKKEYHHSIRRSLRNALWIGGAAVGVVALVAPWMLSLLGHEYAEAGGLPLRFLILAVFPVTFLQMYYAICRGIRRLREATITGVVSGLAGIGAAAYIGTIYGITGMAATWLVIQCLAGIWAAFRIRQFYGRPVQAANLASPAVQSEESG